MVGVDIVQVSRIYNTLIKFGDKFLQRIFTQYEIVQAQQYPVNSMQMARHLAKRFAVKEAYIKARGKLDFNFNQLGVKNHDHGKPYLYLSDKQIENAAISLSDDGDYAVAMIIIQ